MTKELMQPGIEGQVNQGRHLYEEIPTGLSKVILIHICHTVLNIYSIVYIVTG